MAEVKKYRKRPVQVEALEWGADTTAEEVMAFMGVKTLQFGGRYGEPELIIQTLEGPMYASAGDFIIKGIAGEFYPCKPSIFAATYDEC